MNAKRARLNDLPDERLFLSKAREVATYKTVPVHRYMPLYGPQLLGPPRSGLRQEAGGGDRARASRPHRRPAGARRARLPPPRARRLAGADRDGADRAGAQDPRD